ncbi:glycosyltransferase [Paenibacillus albus]|uniref:Glycosyltransferase n=1 Tax=Paenibacillus albus TaxID=2495582 RepID=A0A3Q8X1Y9_9BACL|nr:glycosyltransferase [Paenibacillus albus]AZN38660.1 glycosyltransferase [Paenibacillus albus]
MEARDEGAERVQKQLPLPVSLCIITRNESRFLTDCLLSAAPYVAEIIIVDTGSTDDTVAIGERLGAQVLSVAWTDDFAAARNASLAAAKQPWILVLDADERLEVHSTVEWSSLLEDEAQLGYFVQIYSWVGGDDSVVVTDAVCRLFRNDERIRFRGVIHEEVATRIMELGGARAVGFVAEAGTEAGAGTIAGAIAIWHEGYRDEVMAERDKSARNRRLLAIALQRNLGDLTLRYAAGTELFALGRYAEALEWLEPIELAGEETAGYGSDVLLKIIHACRAVGRLADAVRYGEAGTQRYRDFADMHDALAEVLLEQGDAVGALACARAALAAGSAPAHYSTAAGAGTYRSYCLAGAAFERMYHFDEAAKSYVEAIQARPDYAPAWQRLLLLGSLDSRLREWWIRAAKVLQSAGSQVAVAAFGNGMLLADMLCDLRLPDDAEQLWQAGFSSRVAGTDINESAGAQPSLFVQGIWQAQRGDMSGALQLWQQCTTQGGDTAELAGVYISVAVTGDIAEVQTEAVSGAEITRALLRLGAWPAWVRLQKTYAAQALTGAAGGVPSPLLFAALQRELPAALREQLRGAMRHRLAAGWLSAAGGSWRAAADDFAAAALDAAARPWQRRAAAAGLAAAFAAGARAAMNAAGHAGACLPALQSEDALPLILGTAVLPPK